MKRLYLLGFFEGFFFGVPVKMKPFQLLKNIKKVFWKIRFLKCLGRSLKNGRFWVLVSLLKTQYRQVDIFVLPIDEHQSFATFAFGTIKNLINDLTTPSKITTIHPNPYGMGHTTLKYGSMYIGNIHWKHCHLET